MRLKLNATHKLLLFAVDVNAMGDNVSTTMKNTENVVYAMEKVPFCVKARRKESTRKT
jgi:hypothetical protein